MNPLIQGGGSIDVGDYDGRSLMFDDGTSHYLTRTPGSTSNRKTWTLSFWVKRSDVSGTVFPNIFSGGSTTSNQTYVRFNGTAPNTYFQISSASGGSTAISIQTNYQFRDPSGWYHIVLAMDTTQAVSTDRVKVYVNNVQQTSFNQTTYPALDYLTFINHTFIHTIGARSDITQYMDGYLADFNLIDGQALDPSYFGRTSADTGEWVPKLYAGSYGTNGFRLNFSDTTSFTTLGNDVAPSSNNDWTLTNYSGTTTDWAVLDTPVDDYCVLNAVDRYGSTGSSIALSRGNLRSSPSGASSDRGHRGTIPIQVGQKRYFEVFWEAAAADNSGGIGVGAVYYLKGVAYDTAPGNDTGNRSVNFQSSGSLRYNNTGNAYGNSFTTNDYIMVAVDYRTANACDVWYGENGTWHASGNPATGANPSRTIDPNGHPVHPMSYFFATNHTSVFNFGQKAFNYTPPSGFSAIRSSDLPIPAIVRPYEYFQVKTYTGNGSTRTITFDDTMATAFSGGGMVSIKNRSQADGWKVVDTKRGATKELSWDGTAAEVTDTNGVTAFGVNSFSLGTGANGYNDNTENFVAYAFLENATAGFVMHDYTGTGSAHAETLDTALTSKPDFLYTRVRDGAAARIPATYVDGGQVSDPETDFIQLSESAIFIDEVSYWNDTAPTSTTLTLGTQTNTNENTKNIIAHLWADDNADTVYVVGSYAGNGNADGPFAYTRGRPKFVLVKAWDTTAVNSWYLLDTVRDPHNDGSEEQVFPDLPNVPGTSAFADLLSNGFKIRSSATSRNESGKKYIFLAALESHQKYARAR